jgi:hypothetical protein
MDELQADTSWSPMSRPSYLVRELENYSADVESFVRDLAWLM